MLTHGMKAITLQEFQEPLEVSDVEKPDLSSAGAVVEMDGMRWYRTGDRGHIDEDGFLTIVDRYSRFAKIGGEMVSLTRVEDAVRGVIPEPDTELVAVSVADVQKGEAIVLLVDARADVERIRRALSEAAIQPLMRPAAVYPVDAIPKLGSGKTDLKVAQRLAAEAAAA